MEQVTGIGGVFFRARDPEALAAWYEERLGVPVQDGEVHAIFPESHNTVWSPFAKDTDYWPAAKQSWAVDPEGNRFELWEPSTP